MDNVKELAKAIVTNYVRLPRIHGQEAETSEDNLRFCLLVVFKSSIILRKQ